MSQRRVREIEAGIASFRRLQQEIEAIRKDFEPGKDVQLPIEVLGLHLRRQMRELERQIQAAVSSSLGSDSPQYAEAREFGTLGVPPRSFADYFFFVDQCLFALESERLRLLHHEPEPLLSGIDVATDLYTAPLLLRFLEQEVAWAERKGEPVGLLLLRLPGWGNLTRTCCPSAIKELLISLACIFKTTLRPYDAVCRVGQNQFAVVLREADAMAVNMITARVINAFQRVILHVLGGASLTLEVATGTYPFDAESATDLLNRTAMGWAPPVLGNEPDSYARQAEKDAQAQ